MGSGAWRRLFIQTRRVQRTYLLPIVRDLTYIKGDGWVTATGTGTITAIIVIVRLWKHNNEIFIVDGSLVNDEISLGQLL